jgi:cytochrome c-type biogenesis protein CcmH
VIAEARAAAGMAPDTAPTAQAAAPAVAAAPTSPPTALSGAGLRVSVSLDPALAARVQPGDTLFVFARAAEGPRMPLAIVRQPAGTMAVEVTLDDSSAMAPEFKLSGFPRVVVGARISRSGNATPQPGDLEGLSDPMASQGTASILINRVRE